jgi:subtilase family serine protease
MRVQIIIPAIAAVLHTQGCGPKHKDIGVDLIVTGATVTPAAPTSDDTIHIDFTVANNGPNPEGAPFTWQLRAEDQVLGTGTILALAGHATASGSVDFHALEPGTKTLFLTLDPEHAVAEDNDGDNDLAIPITISAVTPHFDLQFVGGVTLDPASPTSSNATVRFIIRNDDTSGLGLAAENVHWHLYDNGVSLGSNTIASIPANGSQNQSFLLTGTSGGTQGVHHFSIVIDPHHAINESDEGNNTLLFDVGIAPAAGG